MAEIAIGLDAPTGAPARERASTVTLDGLARVALMLVPGALLVFFAFNAGGYFPGTPAVATLVLTQILIVRIVQARRPFAGFGTLTLVAIGALALYAALTLASALWSHSTSRALIEFDRAWMYLLVFVLFASVAATPRDIRWLIRGLVAGIAVVCIAGLATRLLPNVWPTEPGVSNQRLSYPVTYWNTLGLLATLGIVLAFHLTCSLAERKAVRALAAALLPLLAATLFFTFSRGAMLAGAAGLCVYVLFARPRGLLSGALAAAPPTAVLVLVAYHANLLDTLDPTTPAAVAQGHHVAWVAAVCVVACGLVRLLLALVVDRRLRALASRRLLSPPAKRAAIAGAAVLVLVVALALGAPHAISHDWQRFISGTAPTAKNGDLRARLTDPSNDGRTELWTVALHTFDASPLHGIGAAMYQTAWDQGRPHFAYTINAHSLYLQAMAELGAPGLLLLTLLVGTVLVGLALRTRGSQRSLYGALLATSTVWALHAGVDWDWEMPVVCVGFFACAGLALGPRLVAEDEGARAAGLGGRSRGRSSAKSNWAPGHNARLILALACLATVVLPVSLIGSQSRLGEAEHALYASNCTAASSAALSSINWLDVRPEPYEIVGFCDLAQGRPRLAITAMSQAHRRDPSSWETYYAIALAKASAGIDPHADVQQALAMDPHEPLTIEAAKELRGGDPTVWVKRAATVHAAALKSNDLSIVPS